MNSLAEIKPNQVTNQQSNPAAIAPKLMELFAALHSQKGADQKEKYKIYLSNLSYLPEPSVRYAIDRFIQGKEGDRTFVPTVAEIMNVARKHQQDLARDAERERNLEQQKAELERWQQAREENKGSRIPEMMAEIQAKYEKRKAEESLAKKQREVSENEKANDKRWAKQARENAIKSCGGAS